jgi:hypothetical protein
MVGFIGPTILYLLPAEDPFHASDNTRHDAKEGRKEGSEGDG